MLTMLTNLSGIPVTRVNSHYDKCLTIRLDNRSMDDSVTVLLSPYEREKKETHEWKQSEATFPELGSTKFNWLLIKRLFRILRILFPKLLSVTLGFFIFLIFVSGAAQYNFYYAGLIPSKFYGSLTAHKLDDFKTSLYQSIIVLFSACVCKSAVTLVSGIIYVRWRALLTLHIHKCYFNGLNFYKIVIFHSVVDNPDQRITQDVERFCNQLANQLLPKLILWPFIVGYYTYKTFSTMGFIGVLALYGYFIVSTIINKFLMGPVISLVVEQESREGDFRFHHVHVRSNAEPIAFCSGEEFEREKGRSYLGKLLKTQLNLYQWMFPLNLSVNLFDYFGSIITYVILGVLIFSRDYYSEQDASQLAVTISQNAFFSLYLLNNFSILIDQSSNLADMAGYAHRVGHLLEVLCLLERQTGRKEEVKTLPSSVDLHVINSDDSDNDDDKDRGGHAHRCISGTDAEVVFENLTVNSLNSDNVLIEDFTFRFQKHNNVLITGRSGCGKTSLLRVLKQLWPAAKGSAHFSLVDVDEEVMFIPQKPLLTSGSLLEQIVYPQSNVSTSDVCDKVDEVLRLTGLLYLKERFEGIDVPLEDWNSSVSPGEMQKIAFARLCYKKPTFAFLDEATSAMSEEDEEYFYSLIKELGVTYLSIGHRSTIKKFHDVHVHFTGSGKWDLMMSTTNC